MANANCFPNPNAVKKFTETVYHYDTIIGQINGEVQVQGNQNVTILVADHPDLVNLLKQFRNQDIKVIRKTIHELKSDPENSIEEGIEDATDESAETIEVDGQALIHQIESGTNETSAELTNYRTTETEDGQVRVSFDLKVTSTLKEPLIRLNKVLVLICVFLCLATAVFFLFFYVVLKKEARKR